MNRDRLDRIKDVIISEETKAKMGLKGWHDPLYEDMPLLHPYSKKAPKKDLHQKSGIGVGNASRLIYDHYGGGGEPHCIVCGETDRRVLCLHHVHGRKTYPVKWRDIVNEGFPEGWIKPLCANHHRIEHNIRFKWVCSVYKNSS